MHTNACLWVCACSVYSLFFFLLLLLILYAVTNLCTNKLMKSEKTEVKLKNKNNKYSALTFFFLFFVLSFTLFGWTSFRFRFICALMLTRTVTVYMYNTIRVCRTDSVLLLLLLFFLDLPTRSVALHWCVTEWNNDKKKERNTWNMQVCA